MDNCKLGTVNEITKRCETHLQRKQSATMKEIKCGSELEEKQFRHVDDIHAENKYGLTQSLNEKVGEFGLSRHLQEDSELICRQKVF